MRKPPATWTAMTTDDRRFIDRLGNASFLPGSSDKRFVRDLVRAATDQGDGTISLRQRRRLCSMVYRYRRQCGAQLTARALIVLGEVDATLIAEEEKSEGRIVGGPIAPPEKRGNPLDAVFAPKVAS